jgi:excinuclease ABC subunit A
VKVDGEFHELDDPPTLDKKFRHDIDVVVDRIVVREGAETRLADSFRTALDLADGIAILETAPKEGEGDPERITFSENFACPVSGFTIPEIEPRLFSFNAPFGACPACDGLGVELFFDERLMVPDAALSLEDGAIAPWRKGKSPYFLQTIQAIATHYGFDPKAPWKDLPEARAAGLPARLRRDGNPVPLRRGRPRLPGETQLRGRDPQHGAPLPRDRQRLDPRGIRALPEQPPLRRLRRLPPAARGAGGEDRGPACGPGRADVDPRGLCLVRERARNLLSQQKNEIARAILKEIRERLGFLNNVGLEYLTLSRNAGTLSGGEASASGSPPRSARA